MINQRKYKQTEIGRIPKEWELVTLEDIFDIQVGGDIYKLNYSKQKNERYKFPIYSNSVENNGLYGYADTYQYSENCITVTGRGTLGIATPRFEKFNAIIRLLVLIPKANINIIFASKYINSRIAFRIEKTSIPQLTAPKLAKYKIPLPPLPEQQKIAEILSTVDEAIEKVDDSMEKTERLKKGLMQELLTKGIGHEEFKDTEIGRIPKEWEVVRLGQVFSLEYGKGLVEKERENGEYPVYGSNGVVGYHSQYIVKGPGIIIGRKGTIGAVTWSDRNFWPIDTTYYILLKIVEIDLKWLFYKLLSLKLAKLNMATGTPGLNRELVFKLKIPLPSLPEQKKIAEILSTVDKRLELLRSKKAKLERIKKGLMNELLTGRRRVKI